MLRFFQKGELTLPGLGLCLSKILCKLLYDAEEADKFSFQNIVSILLLSLKIVPVLNFPRHRRECISVHQQHQPYKRSNFSPINFSFTTKLTWSHQFPSHDKTVATFKQLTTRYIRMDSSRDKLLTYSNTSKLYCPNHNTENNATG